MRKNIKGSFSICMQLLLIGGAILIPLSSSASPALANQTIYYTGSSVTNFSTGTAPLKSYTVGQTASLQMAVHVNEAIPVNINSNGVKDVFGISLARVMSTAGTTITDNNLNSFTDQSLRANRAAGNDNQVAYSSTDSPVKTNSSWDAYQCGEQWISDKSYKAGGTYVVTCNLPLKQCGIYQVDVNTYYNYANLPKQYQSPDTGHAGVLVGYFFKVECAKPTPTPTHTPTSTPTPISSACNALVLTDQNGTKITNGGLLTTSNDAVQNVTATISGTSNITPITVGWTVVGTDTNTSKSINESSLAGQSVNTTNGAYSASDTFKFGPFDTAGNFGTSTTIPADHNYVYTVTPSIYYMNGSTKVVVASSAACNGNLTTTSVGQVIPAQTTANVSLTKTLVTTTPVVIGQDATFKVVITNTGTEPLVNLNFHDDFGTTGILNLQSATGFETLNGQATDTQSIALVATNGTTSTIDLASISGFQALEPHDSVTLNVAFIAQSQGTDCDVAVVNATSKSGATPTATDHACATVSPTPVSPDTGADTGITISAMGVLGAAVFGKKYLLKMMIA